MDRNKRIYLQLRPGTTDNLKIADLQRSLPHQRNGRRIGTGELHMTLIHIGGIEATYARLRSFSSIAWEPFEGAILTYVTETENLLDGFTTTLTHSGYDLFGPKRTALVATFMANQELSDLHQRLLGATDRFLMDCGIEDTSAVFSTSQSPFFGAQDLKPHVTLHKGYEGELPTTDLGTVAFQPMPILY